MFLSDHLDEIWRAAGAQRKISELICWELTEEEILELAVHVWRAKTQKSIEQASIVGKEARIKSGLSPVLHLSTDSSPDLFPIVKFSELKRTVFGPEYLDGSPWEVSAAGLLEILQFARDHTDSLLFLPSDLRNNRIDQYAKEMAIDASFLRELLIGFREIEKKLDDDNRD